MVNIVLVVKNVLLGFERACRTGNIKTISWIHEPIIFTARYNALRFLLRDAYYEFLDTMSRLVGGKGVNDRYLFHMPGAEPQPINSLCAAAGQGHLDAVKFLCWNSQKIFHINKPHLALILACHNGHTEVVEYLLRKEGVSANTVDELYGSPLYVSRHQLAVTEILLKNGARASVILYDGSTYVLHAILLALTHGGEGRYAMVELLLQYGADVNLAHAYTWETPLMKAALAGCYELVDLLLRYGADVTQKKYDGRTVLDMLRLNYDQNIAYKHILARCQEHIKIDQEFYSNILK